MSNELTFADSGKVLGPTDGMEGFPCEEWLNVSCAIPYDTKSFEEINTNLKLTYPQLLKDFPQFRLKIVKIKDYPHWQYAENNEIKFEDIISIQEDYDDSIPRSFPLDKNPIWRLHLINLKEKKSTKIKFFASHAIADGRSAFLFLDLFTNIAINQKYSDFFEQAKNLPILTSFHKKEYFTEEIQNNIKMPESWNKLIEYNLYPKVDLPSYIVNTQWDFDYPPISKFLRKIGVTPQSLLMVMYQRALRKYHEGKIDKIGLGFHTHINCQRTKYCKDIFKKFAFFQTAGVALIFIDKYHENIIDDLLYCKDKLKDAMDSPESCICYCYESYLVNEKTLEINIPEKMPNVYKHNLIFVSNLGKVCVGKKDVKFGLKFDVTEEGYWPNLYCFNNNETFSLVLLHPNNIDKKFVDVIHDTSKEILDFIYKNK